MKVEIKNHVSPEGKEYFEWDLWDGPSDCSDHAHGYAIDLIQAFSKIFEWRERISNDYSDVHTTNDETLLPGTPDDQESS